MTVLEKTNSLLEKHHMGRLLAGETSYTCKEEEQDVNKRLSLLTKLITDLEKQDQLSKYGRKQIATFLYTAILGSHGSYRIVLDETTPVQILRDMSECINGAEHLYNLIAKTNMITIGDLINTQTRNVYQAILDQGGTENDISLLIYVLKKITIKQWKPLPELKMPMRYPNNMIRDLEITTTEIPIPDTLTEHLEQILYCIDNNQDKRNYEIMLLRYKEGKTMEQIASVYQITRQRVQQIPKEFMRKIQKLSAKTEIRTQIQSLETTKH